ALVAAIAAGCGASLTWQVVVFAVASLVALVFFRPVIIRLFHNRKSEERKSGVEALIGREAVVTETIDEAAATGRVRIDGDDWKAVAADSIHIEKGEKVVVLSIESIVLTVKPKQ
ncbi:MAG: NfeD family protein, partial [Muribaculaceae bacterium]|nr:NfeD family protein [Muribaculaceae bacterium]